MKSKAIFSKSLEELFFLIQETIEKEFEPTLAIVFASINCNLDQLMNQFSFFNIDLFGASSSGEIQNATVRKGGISVLLLNLNRNYYHIAQKKSCFKKSFSTGRNLAHIATHFFANPAFLFVFPMQISGEDLIDGISNEMNGAPQIFGGMAGDDMRMSNSYTFSNKKIDTDLVTALILDNDKVEVAGKAISGWKPIGLENRITKAKNNIIYQINDEPALRVVQRYLGDTSPPFFEDLPLSFLGAAQYAIQMVRQGKYVLRTALNVNEKEGSIMMAGPVVEGDLFRFSIAPGFEVIDQTIEGFKEYATQFPDADAVLMFSCVARHISLGPLMEDEVEGIYNVWKKPMVGFFTYGEVGQRINGATHYYNETCSIVLLKEIG